MVGPRREIESRLPSNQIHDFPSHEAARSSTREATDPVSQSIEPARTVATPARISQRMARLKGPTRRPLIPPAHQTLITGHFASRISPSACVRSRPNTPRSGLRPMTRTSP